MEFLEAWPETPELFALKIWKDRHFNVLHFPLLFTDLTTHMPNKSQIICSSDRHNVPFWAKSHSSNAILPRPANKYTFNVSYNHITDKAINQLEFSNNTHFSYLKSCCRHTLRCWTSSTAWQFLVMDWNFWTALMNLLGWRNSLKTVISPILVVLSKFCTQKNINICSKTFLLLQQIICKINQTTSWISKLASFPPNP